MAQKQQRYQNFVQQFKKKEEAKQDWNGKEQWLLK